MKIAQILWNPDRVVFTIPFIDHPIVWYGVCFALGFLITYFVLRQVYQVESLERLSPTDKAVTLKSPKVTTLAAKLTDQMTSYIVIGILVGARLGYVFFYGWPIYKNDFWGIFKIWEGGLASHGACAGILLAAYFLVRKRAKSIYSTTYLTIMDYLAIISGFFATCIRLGNFMNQEIVGLPTQVPWAVTFLNPMDPVSIVPRHAVQLYEALFYLFVACSMFIVWKKRWRAPGTGWFAGAFLSSLFSFRFFAEFLKEPQGYVLPLFNGLRMGQYLSIPFILVGLILLVRAERKRVRAALSV